QWRQTAGPTSVRGHGAGVMTSVGRRLSSPALRQPAASAAPVRGDGDVAVVALSKNRVLISGDERRDPVLPGLRFQFSRRKQTPAKPPARTCSPASAR